MPAGHVSARATVLVLMASTFAHNSPVMRLSSREETVLAEWKERASRCWWRIDGSLIWGSSVGRYLPLPYPFWCSSWERWCEFPPGAVDRICCYPRVSLSGSSFLSSTLFTLFPEVGCRNRGDSGTEPCDHKNGALCANCCPSGTTAVQFMQVVLIFL